MTASIATNQTILVVGGGISGMTAALEAAECGKQVILVEKTPVLGGRTARLYRYFPKMCHPTCGLEINLRRIKQNRNIRLMTMTEVTAVSGSRGNYSVTLKVAPRFVNENCTACGKCAEAVSAEVANPWNYGLDKMKAAYLPHNMAHPQRFVIDPSIVGTPEGEKAAELRARQIVERADAEARRLRLECEDYCDQRLAAFEIVLERTLDWVAKGREKMQATSTPMPELEGLDDSGFFDDDRG